MEDNMTKGDRQTRVAERAYNRYLARGAQDGQDLDDWLEAEREVSSEEGATAEAPSTESVSARMDASVPEEIARQDPEAGAREEAYESPAAPPRRGRTNGRATTSAHP